ncbi:target of EGR1 protein 1-like [Acanthaster planci]|uniref:Target of EGR1 protein 1 n=1 Tax=Acanthaster planci TaxID=133434 RepID=A0A8B7Y7W3_ACAPL|nr:target of EGR1 protein 1-like [Acanthaster planci]
MAFFSSVPVVDVHRENFKSLWPGLMLAIRSCSYIALDAELSGLGNRKNLLTRSMEERYHSLAEVAKTRSILSLGISCFKVRPQPMESKDLGLRFLAQTFNITTLCSEDYVVEPGSLKFLVDHGFDFNKQYASGVPYCRGVDKEGETEAEDSQTLRALFSELVKSSKPVVFHNGLVDLVFLYQNLYSQLPTALPQFISDLCEIFPAGIFDTKFLAEFEARMPASYLEYAFRKSQRANAHLATRGQQHVAMEFCQFENSSSVGFHRCGLPPSFTIRGGARGEERKTVELCETYAAHGHCKNGIRCPKSHDPDAIQDADDQREERQKRKRKRKRQKRQYDLKDGSPNAKKDKDEDDSCHGDREMDDDDEADTGKDQDEADTGKDQDEIDEKKESNSHGEDSEPKSAYGRGQGADILKIDQGGNEDSSTSLGQRDAASPQKLPKQTGGHRAGYDAFMTGFVLATVASNVAGRSGPSQPTDRETGQEFVQAFGLTEFRNRLFLSAKTVPLIIAKSKYAKTSQHHRQKMKQLGINPT